ncbi:MAG: hypothetical protein PHS53_02965 [Candidatus Pacebacteria bacterium]|nr:hypothetical protein [Candidatus Paceibacterota bacterium]MDD5357083.1 hypothetical protein [Candidatus Paceibacterota bacterium]
MKKLSYLFLLSLLVSASMLIQTASSVQAADYLDNPQVNVAEINLLSETFQSGDTVVGTFTVVNQSPIDVPNIFYTISLVGNYEDGIPGDSYDTKTFGPISLKAQEVRSVPFSYKLPEAVGGTNLGIQIRNFLKSGVPMGWQDAPITVTGGSAFAKVTDAYVAIGQRQFGVQEGPVVKRGQSASLVVALSNTGTAAISVTPKISIFAQSMLGKQVTTQTGASLDLPAKTGKTSTMLLPVFDYAGGVYAGSVSFLDANGVARAPSIQFRYIVAGDIGSIQSITTKSSSVKSGDIISLIANITGAPYDIETGESIATGTAMLSISVFNEKDELVGKNNAMTVDLSDSIAQAVQIDALADAKALRVESSLSYNGAVLSSYNQPLSSNYDEEKANALINEGNKLPIVPIAVVVAIILIGILVVIAVFKKKVQPTALVLIFAVGVLGLVFYGGSPSLRAANKASNGSSSIAALNAAEREAAAQARKDAAAAKKAARLAAKPIIAAFLKVDGKKVFAALNKQVANGKKPAWEDIVANVEAGRGVPAVDVDNQVNVNQKNGKETAHTIAPSVYGSIAVNTDGTYNVVLNVFSPACGNSPGDITAELLSVPGNPLPAASRVKTKRAGGHTFLVSESTFSFGPFVMPTEPGTYEVVGRVTNKVNLGQRVGITDFHISFTVPGQNICTDPEAINNGEEGDCSYNSLCTDVNADNTGEPRPCRYSEATPTPVGVTPTPEVECDGIHGDATCPTPTPVPPACNFDDHILVDNVCVPRPAPAVIQNMTFRANPALISKGNQCNLEVSVGSNYRPTCSITGAGFASPNESFAVDTTGAVQADGSVIATFTGAHASNLSGGIQTTQVYSLTCTSWNGIESPNPVRNGDRVTQTLTTNCRVIPSGAEE